MSSQCWISIADAAKRAGLSRWQMRRRLEAYNVKVNGRLLRWVVKEGGKREVNLKVLLQFLTTEPLDQERALAEVHERIDVLDGRTAATTKLARRTQKALKALQASQEALISSVDIMRGE